MTLVASAGIVAAYGIFQQITGTASSVWLDTEMFSDISGRVVSTFENPNMLGNYLIMIIPICAAFLFSSKSSRGVVSFGIPLMLMLFCLVFTWARGAWLGLIFAAFVFIFIMGRHAVTLTALGIIAIPFLPFVLPDSILNRFMSIGNLGDSSTSYRVYIWRGSLNMARDFFTGGIGVGEGAFREVYPYYSLSGIEAAPHSHNLFLQIMIELGFLGLVLFTFICVFLVLGVFTKIKGTLSVRVKLVAGGCLCGTLAALAQGMTDYIWYNYRVFFIFWALIGLSCAIMRLNTEKDYTGKISQNGKFAYDLEI
jgi:O-antigen ligase